MNLKIEILGLFFLISITTLAQHSSYDWVKQVGGSNTDLIEGLAIDANNNIYTIGSFFLTADLDPGTGVTTKTSSGAEDIYISKLTNNGDLIWVKQIGGVYQDEINDIKLDHLGNIYVCGSYRSTVDFDPGVGVYNLSTPISDPTGFILKLDSNGNFIWAHHLTGTSNNTDDSFYSISINSKNEIYLAGFFTDIVQFSGDTSQANITSQGTADAILIKLDPNGNSIWTRSFGNSSVSERIDKLLIDNNDNVYCLGAFGIGADLDPSSNDFILNSTNFGYTIIKFDSSDAFDKALLYGSIRVNDLKKDNSNNLLLIGNFSGTADFDPSPSIYSLSTNSGSYQDIFISKLDPQDTFLWVKHFVGDDRSYGHAIEVDSYGSIYATGEYSITVDFNPNIGIQSLSSIGPPDAYILKLDAQGNLIWVNQLGGTASSSGSGLIFDQNENLMAIGRFTATVDFDPSSGINTLSSNGGLDGYLYKINNNQIVGIDEIKDQLSITVFGNPTHDFVSFYTKDGLGLNYRLTDSRGTLLEEGSISSSYSQLELKGSSGIYLLQLFNPDASKTIKLIKE